MRRKVSKGSSPSLAFGQIVVDRNLRIDNPPLEEKGPQASQAWRRKRYLGSRGIKVPTYQGQLEEWDSRLGTQACTVARISKGKQALSFVSRLDPNSPRLLFPASYPNRHSPEIPPLPIGLRPPSPCPDRRRVSRKGNVAAFSPGQLRSHVHSLTESLRLSLSSEPACATRIDYSTRRLMAHI